jgi:phenylacetyl-CoA:acceptor oxidoreductase subunit 2
MFGFSPWQQTSWDARAAANFIGGGIGSGVIVFAALSGAGGLALAQLSVAGLVFVAIGLACVFAEIGRPLRAMNVLVNARRSWMTREALVAPMLFVAGAVTAITQHDAFAWVTALLALAFVYCQARILRAARGIPAWRDPRLTPFIVATALAEGAGLFWMCAWHHRAGTATLLAVFGVLVIARLVAWLVYRRSLGTSAAPAALAALDRAGGVLQWVGTLAPLALIAFIANGYAGEAATLPLAAAAGAGALVAGAWAKATLVLRAGFNQGFALPHLPVRGARL